MVAAGKVSEARRLLGVGPNADLNAIRASYRRLLLRSHPDLSDRGDATEQTVRLTAAYRVLRDALAADAPRESGQPPAPPGRDAAGEPHREPVVVAVAQLDDETIGVAAPPDETLFLLIDAAERIGDISYLDRASGLLEVVVEFVEAPTSSIVLSFQGRATGVTEVFCTVEALSGGGAPPTAAVTRLLVDTLLAANA